MSADRAVPIWSSTPIGFCSVDAASRRNGSSDTRTHTPCPFVHGATPRGQGRARILGLGRLPRARYLNCPVQQEDCEAALDVAEARVLADLQDAHDEVPPEAHSPQHDKAGDDELKQRTQRPAFRE